MISSKMYKLTEEQRWYIICEWKKGSINISETARFLKCIRATIYDVIDYYRRHNDVNYSDRYNAGRPPALTCEFNWFYLVGWLRVLSI